MLLTYIEQHLLISCYVGMYLTDWQTHTHGRLIASHAPSVHDASVSLHRRENKLGTSYLVICKSET